MSEPSEGIDLTQAVIDAQIKYGKQYAVLAALSLFSFIALFISLLSRFGVWGNPMPMNLWTIIMLVFSGVSLYQIILCARRATRIFQEVRARMILIDRSHNS